MPSLDLKLEIPDEFTPKDPANMCYKIRFRKEGPESMAVSEQVSLHVGSEVMVRVPHGLEPAIIVAAICVGGDSRFDINKLPAITGPLSGADLTRYNAIADEEMEAYKKCKEFIEEYKLKMQLVKVQKFFDGSKVIFFFTADNRVDFRALVKSLVREFRTRVEMRQIGVRHETKEIGGMGPCGREFCCSSFSKKFDSVSIRMAKEQDLPLNPAKIYGVCNRLLCCLNYEYNTYKKLRKGMPKQGKKYILKDKIYRVVRQNPLNNSVSVVDDDGIEEVLGKEEWKKFEYIVNNKNKK